MRLNAITQRMVNLVGLLAFGVSIICCDVAVPGRPEKVFVSETGRFEIVFPGEPEVLTSSLDYNSHPIDLHSFFVQTKQPTAKYSVGYIDMPEPPDPAPEVFDLIAAGGLEEIGGYELEHKNVTFGDYPSRIITATRGDGSFIKVQMIQAGTRTYHLMAYFPSEGRSRERTSPSSEPLADKFLNSFRLAPR